MAIAGATGVSAGAAHTVPRLLMPEIEGFSLGDLESPALAGVETVEGVPCHHIVGTNRCLGQMHLWVGIQDHLVRKVADDLGEEIRRDIHINETIARDKFSP
jgi:hypothetical protein